MESILQTDEDIRMPSKGRYTAGKQVSRYEADSENIDIEYKNLEGQGHTAWCSNCSCPLGNKKPLVIKALTVTVVFGIGLVLGFLFRKTVYSKSGDVPIYDKPNSSSIYSIKQDYDREFSKLIQDDLEDVYNYEDHMKIITRCVHMSGVGSANKLLDYVEQKWKTFPFDAVKVKKYNVTLSYANYTNMNANLVTVQTANGTLIFHSQYNTSSSHPEYLPFSAYSPSGKVTTTKVVYGHYGRPGDLKTLRDNKIAIKDSLLIVRYGRIHPASKVKNAEQYGAAGVILYSDPADYANNQTTVYPDSWWLPGWAVQLSHVRYNLLGDPSTPDYSSITGVHHKSEARSHFPKIPVQPVRYEDAQFLLSDMAGPVVKNEWFGGLNITYRLGPGYTDDRKVTLQVENMIQERLISNILAVVKGHYESDKYVIIGSHIDSWIQGGVDSGTGYTVIQELARTFAYHIGKGWRPRRTIIFALWDASKYGNIGAYEWVQEHEQQLTAGAVAYINLDALIQGNYSFAASASPLLFSTIVEATQTVQLNCSNKQWCTKLSTIYSQWMKSFPGENNMPKFKSIGDDSDHAPFVYRVGVPILFPQYTFNETMYPFLSTYPAVGALEDTKDYVEKFIDPNYTLHITMTKVLSDVILRLSDSAILPFDLQSFINFVESGKKVVNEMTTALMSMGITIDTAHFCVDAIERFSNAATNLKHKINNIDRSNFSEFDLYILNNKLIHLSRAFISDVGLPGNKHYRNILLAPDPLDLKKEITFPGIYWSVHSNFNKTEIKEHLNEQISLLVLSLNRATDILNDSMVT
ncbi:putative N-acetylated-alpha-linked acidic dipeptidase isoform X2 [Mercenaria mercenaria]|uniref:putative N-acetylated-alpha-linked acidic dipeptidase isoform X2 n=1 Tax=Mercenaria mercenaria TaxID=6596 RepID=UPI00234E6DE7|nr:putative N-acetylated-alpha-linked acidic dipeptidase isoform X2 [Mercenaria mercenaria]